MDVRRTLTNAFQAVAIRVLLFVERVQTGVTFNPLEQRHRDHPYPQYRKLRSSDPFHRSRLVNGWVLTRHDDISAVLRDGRFLVDGRKHPVYEKRRAQMAKAAGLPEDADNTPSMLTLDPPDHTRLRALVSKTFTPRSVEALRPRVEAIVREQLDRVEANGCMDVIGDLANPLPVIVIAELLGIPIEDREQFRRWSDEVILSLGTGTPENVRRSIAASHELRTYFERIAEERRREPKEDLLSALLAAEEAGDRLSMEEVFSTCILLLVAGNETTTNLIGNGLLALLRNREQLELLRDDPSLAQNAVEELLRYDSPVQMTIRFTAEDATLDGHFVKAGQQVVLLLGAANRDPGHFEDPERLDITRQEIDHLSFSNGIHFCLGAPLARLEAQVALPALLERFPKLKLATETLEWSDNPILRGLKELPVTF